jgi:hypothetical protein
VADRCRSREDTGRPDLAGGPQSARRRWHEARAVLIESVFPVGDEFLDGHGSASADDLNEVVRAREDAVLVVGGDIAQVLDQMGRPAQGSQPGGELLDADAFLGLRRFDQFQESLGIARNVLTDRPGLR